MVFLKKKPEVLVDDAKIAELLTRGVERIYPSREFLEKRLKNGDRLVVYLGIDPTGPSLHIGHVIPLLKLRQFQELGHRIILLIGDFTAMIGDPTDKSAARKRLALGEVLANARHYKEQAGRIISFTGTNAAKLEYNSQWLGKLSYADFHNLASLVTVEQFIKRDMFEGRQKAGKPIYLHEFVYPLLQGYDSVAMSVDGEVGGNDQIFNMLVGRDLVRALQKREKCVIALKLLADPAGKKMGKTEGNMVSLNEMPNEIFGKIMSWPDSMIISGFELCTTAPLSEVQEMGKELESGTNPKEIKLKLAEAVVSLLYGKEEAKDTRDSFETVFSKGLSDNRVIVNIRTGNASVADALIDQKIISSKTELRRLIEDGAIHNLDTGEEVSDVFFKDTPDGNYRIGKHRFVCIRRRVGGE